MKRCEEEMEEWANHWQCDSGVQGAKDKPLSNEEFRSLEEGPQLKEERFMREWRGVSRPLRVWAVMGFTPRFIFTCQKERGGDCEVAGKGGAVLDGGHSKRAQPHFTRF